MKIKLEEKNQALIDPDSKYYCGSSCLLSLWLLLQRFFATSDKKFESAFARLNENVLALFDEDTTLFDLSKTGDKLEYDSWKLVSASFARYNEIITDLFELQDYCFVTKLRRYIPYLEHHKEFLCNLAKDNLAIFDKKENKPSFYTRTSFDLLKTLGKENRYEKFR